MRPHPKSLTQPTLPPAVEQALRDARALLAAVPHLVADQDGADIYLSTEQLLAAKEPLVFGVIYADDDQGKAIADLVLRMPQLLGMLIEHLEQPIAKPAASVAIAVPQAEAPAPQLETERPRRRARALSERQAAEPPQDPQAQAQDRLHNAVGAIAKAHLQALEVAQADPTQSLPPAEGWTTVVCLCGKEFWFPPIKKLGMLRCYQCIGTAGRASRLKLLTEHLPRSA